jgi:hypothetical protein
MIPDFAEDGLLPVGIYHATREEFRRRFGIFNRSDRRLRIFEKLDRLLDEAANSGIVKRILVAGSFVTEKPEPNDFDVILVLDGSIVQRELRPFEYNLVSRKMARRLFGGDVIPALEGSAALERYVEFFQTTRDGRQVGMVEVEL